MAEDPGSGSVRPRPLPDDLSRDFWDAARERRLVVQRCTACGRRYYPPVPVCARCSESTLRFEEVSGIGRIASFSIAYDQHVQGFEHLVPFINVWVELDEDHDVLLMTNLLETDAPYIGMPVEVVFEALTDEVVLPQFRPLTSR